MLSNVFWDVLPSPCLFGVHLVQCYRLRLTPREGRCPPMGNIWTTVLHVCGLKPPSTTRWAQGQQRISDLLSNKWHTTGITEADWLSGCGFMSSITFKQSPFIGSSFCSHRPWPPVYQTHLIPSGKAASRGQRENIHYLPWISAEAGEQEMHFWGSCCSSAVRPQLVPAGASSVVPCRCCSVTHDQRRWHYFMQVIWLLT